MEYNTKETARKAEGFVLDAEDLLVINIEAPAQYDENDYAGETWANEICSGFDTLYAPDFDGTQSGNQKGINILILRADLEAWEQSAKDLGCDYDLVWDVEAGHYGDANWGGVDLYENKRDDKFLWVE
jgi:hypothetical protein